MITHWRSKVRSVFAIIGAVAMGVLLNGLGWPWWAWLPAAILCAITVYMAFVLSWFLWRKLSYQYFARMAKRRNRAAAES